MAKKLPSFQFYPGDWMKDPNLRRCSHAAKGVMIDLLCIMFECEERGVLATSGVPWTDDEIVQAVGGNQDVTLACLRELLAKGALHRRESDGAVFSRRMVRDEHQRSQTRHRVQRWRTCGEQAGGEQAAGEHSGGVQDGGPQTGDDGTLYDTGNAARNGDVTPHVAPHVTRMSHRSSSSSSPSGIPPTPPPAGGHPGGGRHGGNRRRDRPTRRDEILEALANRPSVNGKGASHGH